MVSPRRFSRRLQSNHFRLIMSPVFDMVLDTHANAGTSGAYVSVQEPSGNHTPPQLSPSLSQAYPNAGSLDVQHLIMQADARRRRNDNYFEDVPRSKLERQMAQVSMVSV